MVGTSWCRGASRTHSGVDVWWRVVGGLAFVSQWCLCRVGVAGHGGGAQGRWVGRSTGGVLRCASDGSKGRNPVGRTAGGRLGRTASCDGVRKMAMVRCRQLVHTRNSRGAAAGWVYDNSTRWFTDGTTLKTRRSKTLDERVR